MRMGRGEGAGKEFFLNSTRNVVTILNKPCKQMGIMIDDCVLTKLLQVGTYDNLLQL